MGGCCCSSRGAGLKRTPYLSGSLVHETSRVLAGSREGPHPKASEAHAPSSTASAGVLVDTNLSTLVPDTFRAPPTPLPYEVDSHQMVEAGGRFQSLDVSGALKRLLCKFKTDCKLDSSMQMEDAPSKLNAAVASVTEEEDVCPTCFEEYNADNPRIITKCEHHFHLSCIIEWRDRSDTCPICDQIMVIDHDLE